MSDGDSIPGPVLQRMDTICEKIDEHRRETGQGFEKVHKRIDEVDRARSLNCGRRGERLLLVEKGTDDCCKAVADHNVEHEAAAQAKTEAVRFHVERSFWWYMALLASLTLVAHILLAR